MQFLLPHMGSIGMCRLKDVYGFLAVLLRNKGVSTLASLVSNQIRFLHSSLELGMLYRKRYPAQYCL